MRNKTILITGAAGSIGSELCRQLADNNIEVLIEKFGDVPIKIIGAKQGEKITEELMTLEEKSKAIKRGKFWIIK